MTSVRRPAQRAAPSLLAASLLSLCLAAPARAEPAAFGGPKELIHGNYCGPGNNAPLPPVDALDAACARHDACTPGHGLPTQACNLRFQREAEAISRDPRQPEDVRAMAGMAAVIATVIPSDRQRPVAVGAAPGAYAPVLPGPALLADPDPDAGADDAD